MSKYLKQYLEMVQATRSNNTYKTYLNALNCWFEDGKLNFDLQFISQKLSGWNCSQNTKALRCKVLIKFIDFYSNFRSVPHSKLLLETLKSVEYKETVPEMVTENQYKIISNTCNNLRFAICIDLMYQNGLRSDEIINIQTKNYNPSTKTIRITNTKNHNDYELQLTDTLNSKIEKYITNSKSKWLIHTRTNKQLNAGYLRKEIKKICIKSGFPELHCHSFRHGSAMHLLDNNVNLFVIKEHLRHKSLQSTQRYLHISNKQREQVKNIFSAIC